MRLEDIPPTENARSQNRTWHMWAVGVFNNYVYAPIANFGGGILYAYNRVASLWTKDPMEDYTPPTLPPLHIPGWESMKRESAATSPSAMVTEPAAARRPIDSATLARAMRRDTANEDANPQYNYREAGHAEPHGPPPATADRGALDNVPLRRSPR